MSVEFLGLDRKTASTRHVKREYARRLKSCRPDQDPEGFRILHEAYLAALNEVEGRNVAEAPVSAGQSELSREEGYPMSRRTGNEAAPETEAFPEAPLLAAETRLAAHKEVWDVLERLEEELMSGGANVAPLVREAEEALYRTPDAVLPWGQFFHRLLANHGGHPDLLLKRQALVFEMENNGVLANIGVIDRLDRNENATAIASLAEQFRANAVRIHTPAGGAVAARLACAAAFWSPKDAAPLADLAYQNLGSQERDYHMHQIEQHGHMRELLAAIPKRFRGFWRQKLMHVPGSPDWGSKEATEAIGWINMKQVSGTSVAQILRQMLPEILADHVPSAPPAGEDDLPEGGYTVGSDTESANSGTDPLWDQRSKGPRKQASSPSPSPVAMGPALAISDSTPAWDQPVTAPKRQIPPQPYRRSQGRSQNRYGCLIWALAPPLIGILLFMILVLIGVVADSNRPDDTNTSSPASHDDSPPQSAVHEEESLRQPDRKKDGFSDDFSPRLSPRKTGSAIILEGASGKLELPAGEPPSQGGGQR